MRVAFAKHLVALLATTALCLLSGPASTVASDPPEGPKGSAPFRSIPSAVNIAGLENQDKALISKYLRLLQERISVEERYYEIMANPRMDFFAGQRAAGLESASKQINADLEKIRAKLTAKHGPELAQDITQRAEAGKIAPSELTPVKVPGQGFWARVKKLLGGGRGGSGPGGSSTPPPAGGTAPPPAAGSSGSGTTAAPIKTVHPGGGALRGGFVRRNGGTIFTVVAIGAQIAAKAYEISQNPDYRDKTTEAALQSEAQKEIDDNGGGGKGALTAVGRAVWQLLTNYDPVDVVEGVRENSPERVLGQATNQWGATGLLIDLITGADRPTAAKKVDSQVKDTDSKGSPANGTDTGSGGGFSLNDFFFSLSPVLGTTTPSVPQVEAPAAASGNSPGPIERSPAPMNLQRDSVSGPSGTSSVPTDSAPTGTEMEPSAQTDTPAVSDSTFSSPEKQDETKTDRTQTTSPTTENVAGKNGFSNGSDKSSGAVKGVSDTTAKNNSSKTTTGTDTGTEQNNGDSGGVSDITDTGVGFSNYGQGPNSSQTDSTESSSTETTSESNEASSDCLDASGCGPGTAGLDNDFDDSGGCTGPMCLTLKDSRSHTVRQTESALTTVVGQLVTALSSRREFGLFDLAKGWNQSSMENIPKGSKNGLLDALKSMVISAVGENSQRGGTPQGLLTIVHLVTSRGEGNEKGLLGGGGVEDTATNRIDRAELVTNETDQGGTGTGSGGEIAPPRPGSRTTVSGQRATDTRATTKRSRTVQNGSGTLTTQKRNLTELAVKGVSQNRQPTTRQMPATGNIKTTGPSPSSVTKISSPSTTTSQPQSPTASVGYSE